MAANNAAIRKPDEKKNGVKEKKMARLDFYEARQHEPSQKNGGRVTTLPSSHTPTRREEKKMAGTVGCQRRRQKQQHTSE